LKKEHSSCYAIRLMSNEARIKILMVIKLALKMGQY